MNHLWISSSDDFVFVLDSMCDKQLLCVVRDIQSCTTRESYDFKRTCERIKLYCIEHRPRILTAALTTSSRVFLKETPCSRCKFNEECTVCHKRTPFDITISFQIFTFPLCRGNSKHKCMQCVISDTL